MDFELKNVLGAQLLKMLRDENKKYRGEIDRLNAELVKKTKELEAAK